MDSLARTVWPGHFGHGHFGQDFRLGRIVWPYPGIFYIVNNYMTNILKIFKLSINFQLLYNEWSGGHQA